MGLPSPQTLTSMWSIPSSPADPAADARPLRPFTVGAAIDRGGSSLSRTYLHEQARSARARRPRRDRTLLLLPRVFYRTCILVVVPTDYLVLSSARPRAWLSVLQGKEKEGIALNCARSRPCVRFRRSTHLHAYREADADAASRRCAASGSRSNAYLHGPALVALSEGCCCCDSAEA